MGAGEIDRSVKCFLHTHEDLSLDPQDPHQNLGKAVFCNPSAMKAEPGESLKLTGQPA